MPYTLSAIYPLQWKLGFIREENTSTKYQTPSNVSVCPLKSVTSTNYSQVKTRWGWRACRWASLKRFLTVCAEILWLCKPIVAAAVWVAVLRRSWRWKCLMWRSWAGLVACGLRLWGRLDVLPNYLKLLWRWLMVEKWTFNSWATALWTFLQSACQMNAPSKQISSLSHDCVTLVNQTERPFWRLRKPLQLISWLACHHILICGESELGGFLLNVSQNHHN